MMKLRLILLAGLLALGVRAQGAEPAPPPFVNPDAPEAPVFEPGEGAAVPTAPVAKPAKENGIPSAASDDAPAAPQISDDQIVRNGMEMAYQFYHAEDYDACAKATAAILDRYPKKSLYWVAYLNALALEQMNQYARATTVYESVRQKAPRTTYSNAAAFRIGLCQMKSGQHSEAIYTLQEIIENHPRSEYRLQAYIHLGNLFRRTRSWRSAQRIYRDIIRYYPATSWAWTSTMYLAETYAHAGKNSTAIHVYGGMVQDQRVPGTLRAQAQLRIGDLYMVDQRWLEALHAYKVVLRDYSQFPGVGTTAESKIQAATEGRRDGRVGYRPIRQSGVVAQAPADARYRMAQEQEKVPYE